MKRAIGLLRAAAAQELPPEPDADQKNHSQTAAAEGDVVRLRPCARRFRTESQAEFPYYVPLTRTPGH